MTPTRAGLWMTKKRERERDSTMSCGGIVWLWFPVQMSLFFRFGDKMVAQSQSIDSDKREQIVSSRVHKWSVKITKDIKRKWRWETRRHDFGSNEIKKGVVWVRRVGDRKPIVESSEWWQKDRQQWWWCTIGQGEKSEEGEGGGWVRERKRRELKIIIKRVKDTWN